MGWWGDHSPVPQGGWAWTHTDGDTSGDVCVVGPQRVCWHVPEKPWRRVSGFTGRLEGLGLPQADSRVCLVSWRRDGGHLALVSPQDHAEDCSAPSAGLLSGPESVRTRHRVSFLFLFLDPLCALPNPLCTVRPHSPLPGPPPSSILTLHLCSL